MSTQSITIHSSNQRMKGIVLVVFSSLLWGISGTVAQYLFHTPKVDPGWLVTIRLLFSGIILLAIGYRTKGNDIWAIWKHKSDRLKVTFFGLLGMLAAQYTYFEAIDHGNAATATVLQYLAPVFVTIYVVLRSKKIPLFKDVIVIILAVLGTFFLVTHGKIDSLAISKSAFFWGVVSAIAVAFYNLYPVQLLARWGSIVVVGWGMFIGGIGCSFIHPPWQLAGNFTLTALFAIIYIILFGTFIPFYTYTDSLRYIHPSEASLLSCVEPLSSVIVSVIWLQVHFGLFEWFGTACILSTILILSVGGKKVRETEKAMEKMGKKK